MTAHRPIPPIKAADLAGQANIAEALRVLADFAEAGILKSYARLQETRYSDGRQEEVRDARIPRAIWRRIIDEGKTSDVLTGSVRLSGSPELGGGPKMNVIGIRFDEDSAIALVGQHGNPSQGGAPSAPSPSSTDGGPPPSPLSPAPAAVDVADASKPVPPRAAPTPRSPTVSPDAEALTIDQAAVALSIGRTKLYDLVKTQELVLTKIGKRSVISRDQIDRILGKHST